ncbi:hypothetical protein [Rubripirellula lacrimiformis]|uniref:hypothetical protein n=1 Tax=Rubripirellula lacrimiformis TaxID=1930273 RepID=UPI001C54ECCB|nr:hypothetical protein [Rubripirellula lacrimiformis]
MANQMANIIDVNQIKATGMTILVAVRVAIVLPSTAHDSPTHAMTSTDVTAMALIRVLPAEGEDSEAVMRKFFIAK